jgi:hypothetical protein
VTSARVVLQPASAYALLAKEPARRGMWASLRGPLLVVVILSCSISLLTRGYLAPSLILSGMIAWSFVPLAEVAGLAVALKTERSSVAFPWAMDLFFAGHAPWFLWVVVFAAYWSSVSPFHPPAIVWPWIASAVLVAIWSCYVDFFFFRHVAAARKPGRLLFLQRAISWTLFFVIFGGGPLWPGLLERLGIR